MPIAPRADQPLTSALLQVISNQVFFELTPPSGTNTSAIYANLPGTSSTVITKRVPETQLRCELHTSCWVNGAVPTSTEFGIRINGVDYPLVYQTISASFTHRYFYGSAILPGIAAGALSVQLRWRRAAGTGTATVDGSDRFRLAIWEVLE